MKICPSIRSCYIVCLFQFVIDCSESVFKFEQVSGVLKPESRQTLILKFDPQHPINYYRRVTCLIHNQVCVDVNKLYRWVVYVCTLLQNIGKVLDTFHYNLLSHIEKQKFQFVDVIFWFEQSKRL